MIKLVHKEHGKGIICAIDKENIWILTQNAPCASLEKSCTVGCGSCSTRKPERRFSIAVTCPEKFNTGEQVFFSRSVPEPNLVSFLVFGTPVLLAVICMLCWLITAPQKIESAPALLCTAAAFFSGFFILMIFDKLFKKRYPAALTETGEPLNNTKNRDTDTPLYANVNNSGEAAL